MQKLLLLLISSMLMNATLAQSYLETLEKLNRYLQNGKNLFVKNMFRPAGPKIVFPGIAQTASANVNSARPVVFQNRLKQTN